MRDYSVRGLSAGELQTARRELAASLALTRASSPMRAPTEAQLRAIDAELAERAEGDG